MDAAQEYADCLPPDVAADPGGRLGAWLYSCVGVSHAEEAALRGLPGLTLQARWNPAEISQPLPSCRASAASDPEAQWQEPRHFVQRLLWHCPLTSVGTPACAVQGARCNSEIGSWGKDPAQPLLLSFTSALGILQHSPS